MAPKLGVTVFPAPVRSDDDIETAFSKLAEVASSGVIAMNDGFIYVHRKSIIEHAARHQIPAVTFIRDMAVEGALISYGVDGTDLFVRAAPYIDRILRGTAPADLPVQGPTKFELFINLKTAKALGIEVPPSLLARADEVVE
jgi:putative tryptophan/tyrosine transport system substrate-binding protein